MELLNNIVDALILNDFIKLWFPVLATFMMLSYLYKDNPLYKIGEQIFLGTSIGYIWYLYGWKVAILPYLVRPVADMMVDFHAGDLVIIGWLLIGSTLLFRFSRKKAWVSNYYFSLLFGFAAGSSIPLSIQNVMKQTSNLMQPLNQGSFFESSKWFVIIFGTFAALIYFFFSTPHKGLVGKTAKAGIVVMMVFFGATFGSTVMGRVALFIDRSFLIVNSPIQSIVSVVAIVIFLFIYFKFIHKEKEFDDSSVV